MVITSSLYAVLAYERFHKAARSTFGQQGNLSCEPVREEFSCSFCVHLDMVILQMWGPIQRAPVSARCVFELMAPPASDPLGLWPSCWAGSVIQATIHETSLAEQKERKLRNHLVQWLQGCTKNQIQAHLILSHFLYCALQILCLLQDRRSAVAALHQACLSTVFSTVCFVSVSRFGNLTIFQTSSLSLHLLW